MGLFIQTGVIFAMIAFLPDVAKDEFFKSIATAIVVTGWVGFAVGLRDPAKDREQIASLIARLPLTQAPIAPDPMANNAEQS